MPLHRPSMLSKLGLNPNTVNRSEESDPTHAMLLQSLANLKIKKLAVRRPISYAKFIGEHALAYLEKKYNTPLPNKVPVHYTINPDLPSSINAHTIDLVDQDGNLDHIRVEMNAQLLGSADLFRRIISHEHVHVYQLQHDANATEASGSELPEIEGHGLETELVAHIKQVEAQQAPQQYNFQSKPVVRTAVMLQGMRQAMREKFEEELEQTSNELDDLDMRLEQAQAELDQLDGNDPAPGNIPDDSPENSDD